MGNRALAFGLGMSLAAHGLVLSLHSTVPAAAMAPPIVARLVEPQIEPLPAPTPVPQNIVRKVVAPAAAEPRAEPDLPEATTEVQYRYLLATAAARYNAYPPEALINGLEGDVVVRVSVDARGSVGEVSVARSSGHAVLDEQALDMFRRAAREVPVPRALWGRAFGVELRTTYRSG